jgi:hypothetical protein
MAWIYADRVLDTSVTAGTGSVAVSGTSPLGWRTFSTVCAVSDQFYYTIVDPITGAWETGEGTYSAANTVARTTVRASTNAGALVSFAANAKSVFLDVIGYWFAGLGKLPVIQNYLTGCTLSNSGALGIAFAAGQFADSTNASMVSFAGTTKLLSAAWAAGSGNGGRGTGVALTASVWYHCFAAIINGLSDAFFDTSPTGANAPAGTTYKRRVGSVQADGTAANVVAFIQTGDRFDWNASRNDINNSAGNGAIQLRPISVPLGISVQAIMSGDFYDGTSANASGWLFNPASTAGTGILVRSGSTAAGLHGWSAIIQANTAGQIGVVLATTSVIYLWTSGWYDRRGRDGGL